MAKQIITHGKYWRDDIQKADPGVLIACPECGSEFMVSRYDCIESEIKAWAECECGCQFIPDESDIVKEAK